MEDDQDFNQIHEEIKYNLQKRFEESKMIKILIKYMKKLGTICRRGLKRAQHLFSNFKNICLPFQLCLDLLQNKLYTQHLTERKSQIFRSRITTDTYT